VSAHWVALITGDSSPRRPAPAGDQGGTIVTQIRRA
jgi:hypothetical protein